MRNLLLVSLTCCLVISCSSKRSGKPKILVFTKTAGYHHESISSGVPAIRQLGESNGFDVDTTTNAAMFTEDTLKTYAAIVFLSTTGDVLNNYQEADFERYIQAGGGYVGIHAAADMEYDWNWYGRLAGGYFLSHPGINDTFPNVQEATITVVDTANNATKHLPRHWKRTDEYYSYKKLNKDVHVLLTIDEKSYPGGENGSYHPVAWYHEYDGGRAFYTALGHTKETFSEEPFLKHLLAGIQYAIGDNAALDYSRSTTLRVPDEDRFTKTVLTSGNFFEPTEMTILPNLDILIAQRRGEILLYKKGGSTVKQAGFLNVYFKTLKTPKVNAEEGVLGIKADPDFAKNHYVYVFYSPADTSVNRLSRFTFENDTLDLKTEKVVLQFYSQREICCHTGGSVAFDKDGLIYVSTGDNSTPFDEPGQPYANHGFAPLDDRPGHEQYDARRSAGNANDLRGKILRVRVKADGTYEIPNGNLYTQGTAGTRPEIYVQGNRNPYRISVDQKNGYLYWGEVGPDANNDSLGVRGPRGYDEINQARKAGYFGWPLFVGNNYAYNEHNYNLNTNAAAFDPAKPMNNSRNNTGIKQLPPAQPAFIWYPYAASPDFPQLGAGGRNAMAGPVYYKDMYPSATRLPDYYDKKLFIYDWIRGWIKAVTLQPNGDFDKMEPFMAGTKLNSMIDFEMGPDGQLYMLEYGTGWFTKNANAALSRVDYNAGNRPPKVGSLTVDRTSGVLPFTVALSATANDPEGDELSYVWDLGNGEKKETAEPSLTYTFTKAGDYAITLEALDNKKAMGKSTPVAVYAGNVAPELQIAVTSNKTFYFPGKPVKYAVSVTDKNDPAAATDPSGLFVSSDYIVGSDRAATSQGHQVMSEAVYGKNLMLSLDCKTCHQVAGKSIGPAYMEVSKKYQQSPDGVTHLVNKIIKGGSGVWGETVMPAHPDLKESDARQIVAWIQTLAAGDQTKKSLPASGTITATSDAKVMNNKMLAISASYTDRGGAGIKPLTGSTSLLLRNPAMNFANAHNLKGYSLGTTNGSQVLNTPRSIGSFSIDSLDLTGITGAQLSIGWKRPPMFGYSFEIHLDSPEGKKLGQGSLAGTADAVSSTTAGEAMVNLTFEPVTDGKKHTIYIVSNVVDPTEKRSVMLKGIVFMAK